MEFLMSVADRGLRFYGKWSNLFTSSFYGKMFYVKRFTCGVGILVNLNVVPSSPYIVCVSTWCVP